MATMEELQKQHDEQDDQDIRPQVCEDCQQVKCVCPELDEL